MAGDFNHVARPRDRFHADSAGWTDHADTAEEAEFMRLVADPIGLYEVEQPAPTHANAHGRSRLDRVYWNAHLVEQLDRHVRCGVMEWIPHISAHRVVFYPARLRPAALRALEGQGYLYTSFASRSGGAGSLWHGMS